MNEENQIADSDLNNPELFRYFDSDPKRVSNLEWVSNGRGALFALEIDESGEEREIETAVQINFGGGITPVDPEILEGRDLIQVP